MPHVQHYTNCKSNQAKLDYSMARDRQLRVYYGPEDTRSVPLSRVRDDSTTVDISLQELLDILGDAVRTNRAWTDDFRDEQVKISTDLYEVISAYGQMKRSA